MILKSNFPRLLRRFARGEDGAMAITLAVMLPFMIGMVALVEAGRVYSLKNQLQATADAAALASVREDPKNYPERVAPMANLFAESNMPEEQYGDVLIDSNVELGHWDGDAFDPASAESDNAVKVTTVGEMPLFFAAALSNLKFFKEAPTSLTPSAQATALWRLDKCYTNGFVAGGIVDMNSQNTFHGGFCVYGRAGVTMNNSNEFAAGTGVGMLDLNNLTEGGNNPGLHDALVQKDISTPPPGRANELIEDFFAGGDSLIPDYITSTWRGSTQPSQPLVAGRIYLYEGTEPIELSGTVEDVAIISRASIKIKSNSNLRNVVLASSASVDISSNVNIGDANYCDTGEGASLIISGGAVTDKKDVSVGTNSNISLHGVQVVSEGTMEMNSNLTITGASVQATQNIVFNSSFDVAGCADKSANVTGEGTMVAELVD